MTSKKLGALIMKNVLFIKLHYFSEKADLFLPFPHRFEKKYSLMEVFLIHL